MHSIFEIFKVGIGPSSSHTVAPMKAGKIFRDYLINKNIFHKTDKINITLQGSLAFTGKGHGTDKGIILGLSGKSPETIDNADTKKIFNKVKRNNLLNLDSTKQISFSIDNNFFFDYKTLTKTFSNVMIFNAFDSDNKLLLSKTIFSIGGGFIKEKNKRETAHHNNFPNNFTSSKNMLDICKKNNLKISDLMMENECSIESKSYVKKRIMKIWETMDQCIDSGIKSKGTLNGKLKVKRRAADIYETLKKDKQKDPLKAMDWVSLYAIAVNEENANGGKVVTAPTNGAAGIIPAVLKYYIEFTRNSSKEGIVRFFLTAGAIGVLYKENASISGAEVGCQGEVGVACSMAAGGLVSALNGSNAEIENAAEIAMEHNLGLTCDPVGGLVQIPCIERNAMGSVKAINAARLAMIGKGNHKVTLDDVIKTMMQTGKDMQSIYKETSNGGLAVNVPEC
ncbi:MAG: L-serine ammonia-lyase [Candidatus Pelagibacter sp. TMED166]|nr:MAG: L-serine ammonia-lyase [Candidatus Pelagibacter sp. TMED166]